MNSHGRFAMDILATYDSRRIDPDLATDTREAFLTRLLLEAQVHATLAMATELELHRLHQAEIWGKPAVPLEES